MRDIPDFEDFYQISTEGIVVSKPRKGANNSTRKPKVMSIFNNGRGYYQVNLTDGNSIRKKYYVHRLVYITYKGSIPEGYEIDHIDNDKSNNSLDNLRVVTRKENMQKCYRDNPHILNNLKNQ